MNTRAPALFAAAALAACAASPQKPGAVDAPQPGAPMTSAAAALKPDGAAAPAPAGAQKPDGAAAAPITAAAADASKPGAAASPAQAGSAGQPESIALPGGPPVGMDYLAYDPETARLFVPASNTGKLDVLDTRTGKLTAMDGWPTAKRGERTAGITAATTGAGHVFVGNRADRSLCAVEIKSLTKRGCVTLPDSPDGVFYVAPTHEVWVTTPESKSLQVIDVSAPAAPRLTGSIVLEGEPEGYAVDTRRGLVFTNLEDKNRTLSIDARSHKVLASWATGCGEKGPRGLVVDEGSQHLFVACAVEGLRSLDSKGAIVARLETGAGVDNVDWLAAKHLLYVASSKAGTLTVVEASADGSLKAVSSTPIPAGRTVMVDGEGNAYIPDSKQGRLIVVRAAK